MRRALGSLAAHHRSLSYAALEGGFADHPHFTRTIRAAAGMPPSILRRWLQRG
jgi:AraC-like DNA-binding protein